MIRPDQRADIDTMQSMIARLHRAKWLEGSQIVRPEGFSLTLSALGAGRMLALGELFRPMVPTMFGQAGPTTASGRLLHKLRLVPFFFKMCVVITPLRQRGNPISTTETNFLMGLAVIYALEGGKTRKIEADFGSD